MENKTKAITIDKTDETAITLGTYILTSNRNKNNDQNFVIKIQKMETKLHIWLSRDLTLMFGIISQQNYKQFCCEKLSDSRHNGN